MPEDLSPMTLEALNLVNHCHVLLSLPSDPQLTNRVKAALAKGHLVEMAPLVDLNTVPPKYPERLAAREETIRSLRAAVPGRDSVKDAGISGTSAHEVAYKLGRRVWEYAWNAANMAEVRKGYTVGKHRKGRQETAGTQQVLENQWPAVCNALTAFPTLDAEALRAKIATEAALLEQLESRSSTQVSPLTRTEKATLALLHKTKGRSAKQLVKELGKKGHTVEESTLRRHILPKLKAHCGVRNVRSMGGYIKP